MKKRTFTIDCSSTSSNSSCFELQRILIQFIDTAFPPNGSDCAQATRSSLLELTEVIKNSTDDCTINTRLRPLLKTAITWYFEDIESNTEKQQALLTLIAKKKK